MCESFRSGSRICSARFSRRSLVLHTARLSSAVLLTPLVDAGACPPLLLQAAFNKIPSGGPLLPLINGALVLGVVGYCGYNSVFTGKAFLRIQCRR